MSFHAVLNAGVSGSSLRGSPCFQPYEISSIMRTVWSPFGFGLGLAITLGLCLANVSGFGLVAVSGFRVSGFGVLFVAPGGVFGGLLLPCGDCTLVAGSASLARFGDD
jgi:hypothetical protein